MLSMRSRITRVLVPTCLSHGLWGAMATSLDDLGVELCFSSDLADGEVLNRLQDFLSSAAAKWSSRLRVMRYERDRDAIAVDVSRRGELVRAVLAAGGYRGETYQALARKHPPTNPRRSGYVLMYGANRSMRLSVRFDESVPAKQSADEWLFSNTINAKISSARLAGMERARWALGMLTELGADPSLLWGASYLDTEFRAKNRYDGPDGSWALGRDMRVSLPGVFWANVFGEPYIRLIGRDRLTSAPGRVIEVGQNVLVVVHDNPEDWAGPSASQLNQQVIEHLGAQYFFDRHAPDRPTRAPDYGLPPLPTRDPVRVVATGGNTYTILPVNTDDRGSGDD
jgi:hypothetical protein